MGGIDQFDEYYERMKEFDNIFYGYVCIYPHPLDLGEFEYSYNHDDLAAFSKRALEKYNQDKHKRYQFVELVEGFLHSSHVCDSITAYFNAGQPGDMNVTFVATTDVPPASLSLPKHDDPQIIHVFPWTNSVRFSVLPYSYYCSDTSESGDAARHPEEQLEAQVGLLKV